MRTQRSSAVPSGKVTKAAARFNPRVRDLASRGGRLALCAATMLSTFVLTGCETDSWFDPSRTGYFEFTPTTMPVLSRLDVVEREAANFATATPPTADDLQPGELQYQLTAGDEVRVEVFELVTPGQTDVAVRTVDPSGNVRLPTIGEVPAAGLTIAQLQREIEDRLRGYLPDPIVSVVLEKGQGFTFVIYGAISGTGVYGLTRPDFRLMDALALAGGTLNTTERVFVIRSAPLESSLEPSYRDRGLGKPGAGAKPGTGPGAGPGSGTGTDTGTNKQPVDIEELINKLPESGGGQKPPEGTPPTPTPPGAKPAQPPEPAPTPEPSKPSPGALAPRQDDKPPVDVDDLTKEPAKPTAPAAQGPTPMGGGWVWDATKQQWVESGAGGVPTAAAPPKAATPAQPSRPQLFATRVIEISYQDLARGESNYNIIIRPGDRIYVDPPPQGVVYVGGEVNRIGVYEMPQTGGKLTLSRLIDAAGGLSQIAIPSRVDLVRIVGPGREAAVRVDLAAIRNRQEPDIIMKPDDHVIVGTNFFATPLAVIRNGFRMTYGFGFLLDRNFGNDVFGPPPESIGVSRG